MEMPGRKWTHQDYRYAMNTQEKTPEIFDGSYIAKFWEYDSRIGRRWNLDPVLKDEEAPYVCFRNSPISLSDFLGDDVDIGKKKQRIDESKKKRTSTKTVQKPMDIEEQAKTKENQGKEEIVVGHNMKNTSKTIYLVDGDEVSEKEYNKANEYNNKIDKQNQDIDKHNSLIDKKKEFFESAGMNVKYDPKTGLITNATKIGDLKPEHQTLFDAVNSNGTYKFKVGGNNIFSFDGKKSFTMSGQALYSGDRAIMHKIVAGDAAEFLGKTSSSHGTLVYLGKIAPKGVKQNLIFDNKGLTIENMFKTTKGKDYRINIFK